MHSHARALLRSPAATLLFHPAELFPTINFNLAWALPPQPDPPWGLGLGRGRRRFPQPTLLHPGARLLMRGLHCCCPFPGLGFPKMTD